MLRWYSKLKIDGGVQIKYLKLARKIAEAYDKMDLAQGEKE
jgi:hypothetical protein